MATEAEHEVFSAVTSFLSDVGAVSATAGPLARWRSITSGVWRTEKSTINHLEIIRSSSSEAVVAVDAEVLVGMADGIGAPEKRSIRGPIWVERTDAGWQVVEAEINGRLSTTTFEFDVAPPQRGSGAVVTWSARSTIYPSAFVSIANRSRLPIVVPHGYCRLASGFLPLWQRAFTFGDPVAPGDTKTCALWLASNRVMEKARPLGAIALALSDGSTYVFRPNAPATEAHRAVPLAIRATAILIPLLQLAFLLIFAKYVGAFVTGLLLLTAAAYAVFARWRHRISRLVDKRVSALTLAGVFAVGLSFLVADSRDDAAERTATHAAVSIARMFEDIGASISIDTGDVRATAREEVDCPVGLAVDGARCFRFQLVGPKNRDLVARRITVQVRNEAGAWRWRIIEPGGGLLQGP